MKGQLHSGCLQQRGSAWPDIQSALVMPCRCPSRAPTQRSVSGGTSETPQACGSAAPPHLPDGPTAAAERAPVPPAHEQAAARQAGQKGGRDRKIVQQRQQAQQHKLRGGAQQHHDRGRPTPVQPPVHRLVRPCSAWAPRLHERSAAWLHAAEQAGRAKPRCAKKRAWAHPAGCTRRPERRQRRRQRPCWSTPRRPPARRPHTGPAPTRPARPPRAPSTFQRSRRL